MVLFGQFTVIPGTRADTKWTEKQLVNFGNTVKSVCVFKVATFDLFQNTERRSIVQRRRHIIWKRTTADRCFPISFPLTRTSLQARKSLWLDCGYVMKRWITLALRKTLILTKKTGSTTKTQHLTQVLCTHRPPSRPPHQPTYHSPKSWMQYSDKRLHSV